MEEEQEHFRILVAEKENGEIILPQGNRLKTLITMVTRSSWILLVMLFALCVQPIRLQ